MKKKTAKRGLSGATRLLYEKLSELVNSLAPGAPLPPVRTLKAEFGVGYAVLNRALLSLEREGRIVIKEKKGVFAAVSPPPPSAPSGIIEEVCHEYIPWGGRDHSRLRFLAHTSWMGSSLWRELAEAYNRGNPPRPVDFTPMTEGALKEAASGAKRFDVAAMSSHLAARKYFSDSHLLNLRPFVDAEKPQLPLHEHAWDVREDGGLKGVAPLISMTLLAYRRSVFAGQRNAFKEELTHAGLLELASGSKSLAEPGNLFVFLGYMSFFFRHGVSFLGVDRRTVAFPEAKAIQVLEFLRKVSVDLKLSPYCSESYHIYESPDTLVKRTASLIECHAAMPFPEDTHGFVPMPIEPGGVHPLFTPVLLVNADTLQPEDAWGFIRFILAEEGQRIIARYPFGLPAAREITPSGISPEKLHAMRRTMARGRLAYADSDALYHARFIIEMLIEKWLKGAIDVKTLGKEIENRGSRFMRAYKLSG